MQRLKTKLRNLAQRKQRVRAQVAGTGSRPRLSVFISNQHVTAQIIDDTKGITLAYATTANTKKSNATMTTQATEVGIDIAKKAKAAKVRKVVFDRNGKLYHGRIKALAEAARAEGLEF